MSEDISTWYDSVYDPIIKSYRYGGLALAFFATGVVLMLTAFASGSEGAIKNLLFGVGVMLISSVWVYFLLQHVRPLLQAKEKVEANKKLISSAQGTGDELAALAEVLQELAFRHASCVSHFLQEVRPQIRALPIVGVMADSEALVNAENLSLSIAHTGVRAKDVLRDVRSALTGVDHEALDTYRRELAEIRRKLEELIPHEGAAQP